MRKRIPPKFDWFDTKGRRKGRLNLGREISLPVIRLI